MTQGHTVQIDLEPVAADPSRCRVRLTGPLTHDTAHDFLSKFADLARAGYRHVELDAAGADPVDTTAAAALVALQRRLAAHGIELHVTAASTSLERARSLASTSGPGETTPVRRDGFLQRVGARGEAAARAGVEFLVVALDALYYAVRGAPATRRVRRGAAWQETLRIGVEALPIIGLVALLIGVVVALQSAYQLRQFGADIYVADLIAISMTREMGPLMTAILVAGRSGASIAAEIGVMKVGEEIDALRAMGLQPVRYVLVPKLVAMTVSLPALSVYAVAIGIAGGFAVAWAYLDIGATAFWNEMLRSLFLKDVLTGLSKTVVFGWIIVFVAGWQGFRAQGGAQAVGRVTTASVVASLFWVIVADAAFSVIFYFGD